MRRTWYPYLALLLAICFFVWVKYHQQGNKTTEHVAVNASAITYSKHARCRMDCRHITAEEVQDVLANGRLDESRTRTTNEGTSYAMEGTTLDEQHVRIVYSPHSSETVIVTVIDLDKDWPCNCN